MDKILISNLLNYENDIFNKFIQKRANLIKTLENIEIHEHEKLIFLKNLKNIIDCVKSANDYMDNFNLEQTDSEIEFIQFYFLFKDIFLTTSSSELSDVSESSSESSESSDSSDSPELSEVSSSE
jgi:hypothetical protein